MWLLWATNRYIFIVKNSGAGAESEGGVGSPGLTSGAVGIVRACGLFLVLGGGDIPGLGLGGSGFGSGFASTFGSGDPRRIGGGASGSPGVGLFPRGVLRRRLNRDGAGAVAGSGVGVGAGVGVGVCWGKRLGASTDPGVGVGVGTSAGRPRNLYFHQTIS